MKPRTQAILAASIWIAICFAMGAAIAQQPQPDPVLMQKSLDVIAGQRNTAQNNAAILEARVSILTDELTKAHARIKELEDAGKKDEPK